MSGHSTQKNFFKLASFKPLSLIGLVFGCVSFIAFFYDLIDQRFVLREGTEKRIIVALGISVICLALATVGQYIVIYGKGALSRKSLYGKYLHELNNIHRIISVKTMSKRKGQIRDDLGDVCDSIRSLFEHYVRHENVCVMIKEIVHEDGEDCLVTVIRDMGSFKHEGRRRFQEQFEPKPMREYSYAKSLVVQRAKSLRDGRSPVLGSYDSGGYYLNNNVFKKGNEYLHPALLQGDLHSSKVQRVKKVVRWLRGKETHVLCHESVLAIQIMPFISNSSNGSVKKMVNSKQPFRYLLIVDSMNDHAFYEKVDPAVLHGLVDSLYKRLVNVESLYKLTTVRAGGEKKD